VSGHIKHTSEEKRTPMTTNVKVKK